MFTLKFQSLFPEKWIESKKAQFKNSLKKSESYISNFQVKLLFNDVIKNVLVENKPNNSIKLFLIYGFFEIF